MVLMKSYSRQRSNQCTKNAPIDARFVKLSPNSVRSITMDCEFSQGMSFNVMSLERTLCYANRLRWSRSMEKHEAAAWSAASSVAAVCTEIQESREKVLKAGILDALKHERGSECPDCQQDF